MTLSCRPPRGKAKAKSTAQDQLQKRSYRSTPTPAASIPAASLPAASSSSSDRAALDASIPVIGDVEVPVISDAEVPVAKKKKTSGRYKRGSRKGKGGIAKMLKQIKALEVENQRLKEENAQIAALKQEVADLKRDALLNKVKQVPHSFL